MSQNYVHGICFERRWSLPEQVTPTSCSWVQLCFPHPSCLQSQRADSFPVQETLSIQMSPEPALELAHPRALIEVGHPSCRQTTETSFMPQPFLHTVPHFSRILSSTLPVQLFPPPVSLSSFFIPPAITIEHSNDGQAEFREQVVLLDDLHVT